MSLRKSTKKSKVIKNCHLINEVVLDKSDVLNYDPNNGEKYGKVYMNETFDLKLDKLFECLFEYKQFYEEFAKRRKIFNFQTEDWNVTDGFRQRTNRLEIEVGGIIGGKICKNTEHIKVIKYENDYCIVEAETYSSGILYVDCFKLCYTYWLTKSTCKNSTNLLVRGKVRFISKPNFFIKSIIEKMCDDGLKENFEIMIEQLNKEEVKPEKNDSEVFSSDDEVSDCDDSKSRISIKKDRDLNQKKILLSNKNSSYSNKIEKRVLDEKECISSIFNDSSNRSSNENNSRRDITNFLRLFFVLMVFLLLLNLFLFKRLRDIEKIGIEILKNPSFTNRSFDYKRRFYS
ncbi:unnamed protein product [Brachionus calyciflorus]|uniref:VASt domain-containing protein n=1 Tax=Brachionus calyciflorus TaxID=104777 RepID=A0A813Y530_9BILA|nr:unnamed protein product [Brachionus calyciflorus]